MNPTFFFRAGLWLICFFLLLEPAFAGNDAALIQRAETLLNKGWYLEALGRLQELVEHTTDPDIKAKALLLIGETYGSYLDQHDIALAYFDNIMATYPGSPAASDALFSSGMTYFNKGDYTNAHSVFTRYRREYPDGMRFKSAAVWADIAEPLMKPAAPVKAMVSSHPKPAKPKARLRAGMEPVLRVLTHKDADSIRISSTQPLLATSADGRKRVYSGWGPVILGRRSKHLILNGRPISAAHCRVISAARELEVNGRSYRGDITVSATAGGLMAVNHVPTEQYLYGVIPGEMPSDWPMEALMAQAVAARTYALYMKEKNERNPYDVAANTVSQVYGGLLAETRRTNRAVDKTRGQVMTHDGRLIAAYYHSNSGGHTEDPRHVWNARIPYLRGIPDRFSNGSTNEDWECFLTYEEITRRLRRCGLGIGKVAQLNLEGKSRSGRNLRVLVVSDKGITPFSSSNFRMTMGENIVKSTLFHILPSVGGVRLKGRGYGHGVGMSQWGAKQMARLGSNYRDILTYYYHGIQIVSLNS
ncbi:MAG: SpoIID/LytB domain-containing protein [Thermodesulfobacteriota bacterium]